MLYIHTAQNILYLAQSKIDLFHLQKNPKEWQIQNTKTSVEILRFAEVCHCSVKIPNNLQDKGQTSQRCLCSTLHCCHHHCPPAFLLIPLQATQALATLKSCQFLEATITHDVSSSGISQQCPSKTISCYYQGRYLGFPGGSDSKESACNVRDLSSIPGLGRSPGEGKGQPLQYSGLENPMDHIVCGVAKSWTLSNFHFHFHGRNQHNIVQQLSSN